MRIPKRVTLELLRDWGACRWQRTLFRRFYPNGAELTVAEIARARRRGFDVWWFAEKMLYESSRAAQCRYWNGKGDCLQWLRRELKAKEEKEASKPRKGGKR